MEIAINLRRNTPQGKHISMVSEDTSEAVHIIIKNECIGIPEGNLDMIFEPFFRYQDPMNHSSGYEYSQGGIGMGLAIIKKYMDQAGGAVWFENAREYAVGVENRVDMHLVFPAVSV